MPQRITREGIVFQKTIGRRWVAKNTVGRYRVQWNKEMKQWLAYYIWNGGRCSVTNHKTIRGCVKGIKRNERYLKKVAKLQENGHIASYLLPESLKKKRS